jgi:hypothetical protein
LLNVARDLRRRCTLFFYRGGDGSGDRADLLNCAGDTPNGFDGLFRRGLNMGDLGADLLRCLTRLSGKAFDFGRDYGEAFPGVTGPGGFYGGVQRQPGWSGL